MPVGKLPLSAECVGALNASNPEEAVGAQLRGRCGERCLLPLASQAAEQVGLRQSGSQRP